MRFVLISETSVPPETPRLLRDACEARGIPFEEITAKTFDFHPARRLEPGDMLFKAAVSLAASRTEQHLYRPGVATFYSQPGGVYTTISSQVIMATAAGIRTPETIFAACSNPSLLAETQIERLGGFPVVVKVLGRSSGIGVMLAESMASLRSLVDFTVAQGQNPLICRFIRGALHWRVIVLGSEAIASYRNKPVENDFRSRGSTDPADFTAALPEAVAAAAIQACAVFGFDFAGVDILEDPAGRAWFLEANFPCYYPHAQLHGGFDIAGRMVDFLARKAGHIPAASPRPLANHKIHSAAVSPDVFIIDDFLSPADCAYVLRKADAVDAEPPAGLTVHRDSRGFSFEMPVRGDGILAGIMNRIHRVVGIENDFPYSFRFRRYKAGESHRPHLDEYEMNGRILVATALLYLADTEEGGETRFPNAEPEQVLIEPRRGRLAVWFNYRADGTPDPAALHESLPVERGLKATIGNFVYKEAAEYAKLRLTSPVLQAAQPRQASLAAVAK